MSEPVFLVAKRGKNVFLSNNPNDFIVDSRKNTFKIIGRGNKTVTVTSGTDDYSFNYNPPTPNTSCMVVFVKFPDGKATHVAYQGMQPTASYSYLLGGTVQTIGEVYWDGERIYFTCENVTGTYDLVFSWMIFEPPL